ncbi:MAG: Holliday junction resolvase RuvX [Patescibacteria group bacterium]
MNYLGIDYGTKRIGIARSVGWLAEPVIIVHQNADAIDQIVALCKEYQIDEIVCGVSEGEMAEATKVFAHALKEQVNLPIHFMDETMSSKEVQKMILASGKKMKDRQEPIDHYAAAHILQQFLEEQENN